ncbi:MAG: ABC transporter substrate-binding protein [Chloroflexia bacterium]
MSLFKSRITWLIALAVILMPLLAACGGDTSTPTSVPAAATDTPAAAAAAATDTPAAAATDTPAAAMTPTEAAMAGETPTAAMTGTTGTTDQMAALAAEGIKPDPSASGKFEFFSWWTAGGEADGKNDILNLYKQLYPGVQVVDAAVAGGAGNNAKAVLKTRMQGNDPPDTFQVHGGPELIDGYVKAGRMDPVTSIYTDMNMKSAYPAQLLSMVSDGGEIYSVPANIHRGNVLFYNTKVFKDNNLTPPKTWADIYTVSEALKAKGIAPFAVGSKDAWPVTMLFEDALLANVGADKFNALMSGKADWTDPGVVAALGVMQKLWTGGYINKDNAAQTWDQAAGEVLKGTAAMTVMGDWAKGYFQANDKDNWSTDIGWMPTPGTEGIFKVITDSFGLPKGAKDAQNTKNFLKLIGSKVGQVTFNLRKGSIPARTDVDTSQFDVYMKSANADFASAKSLVGSAPHGSATNDAFASALNDGINAFVAAASDPAQAAKTAADLAAKATDLLK